MRDIPAIRERERRQGVGAVIREAEYCTDFLIVVDQGGPSCMTLPGFRHFVAETAETRVYAFLSAYLAACRTEFCDWGGERVFRFCGGGGRPIGLGGRSN
jgi:hypothetical protein